MRSIEVVKQQDLQDCGACALSCIIKYYGGYIPLEKIREDTYTNATGTTAYHLIKAAISYGFDAIGIKAPKLEDENIYLPAIAHVVLKNGLQHFVVLYKISSHYVYLMDPARGKIKMTKKEFLEIWSSVLILLTPKTEILKFDKQITLFTFFLNFLKNNNSLFKLICFINILLMIIIIASNFYFEIAISSLNSGKDIAFLKFSILIFFMIYLMKIILNYLKNYYLNYFNKNIDSELFLNFINHIFNLPLSSYQNRTTGEIISRIEDLSQVKSLISEVFLNLILNLILIGGAIVSLYFINDRLFFLLCLIICLYILTGLVFSQLIYRKIKENLEVTTEFNTTLVEEVEMNTSIKNLNLITPFLERLENKLILMLKSNFHFTSLSNFIAFLKNGLYELGLFSITTYGIILIYEGHLEVLSLVTFNSLILYLFDPVKEVIDLIPKYNYLKAVFAKLSDFLNIKEEVYDKGLKSLDNCQINFTDVTYSYNNYKNILDNIKFMIKPGERIILHGKSGSGKSTICKLLYRFLTNYTGKIEYNITSEKDFSLNAIRENILYVGQEEKLFTGSIKDNIVCFRNISDSELLEVLKICQIEKIIANKPNRLETIINASLNTLSGGEKQRIILARGLLKKAKIIILDEALSEVNIEMEQEILNDIMQKYLDNTIIYVSHKEINNKFSQVIEVS